MEAPAAGRNLEIVLLHELSSGTFARLYLAEARASGGIERVVAVKILREQWNDSAEVINRTRDEARLLARLRHKNILRVEDLSEIDGQLAIIMEFVDGLDLKQLVEALKLQGARIPARAALQIAAETAAALEAAYFKVPYGLDAPLHVVHRDIKPSNVMVSVEGELKVLDFGTARSTQEFRSVQTGALRFGSLKYMSPERREGDRGEHAADVYALGLTLLEILSGGWLPLLPMDLAEHDQAVAEAVGRLGALGMPNRDWDVALRQILLQMLASDAEQRPTAEQAAKLLRAFAEQGAGETLDTFGHETVAPLARQIRGNLEGGALSGTRFVVSHFDPAAGGRAGAEARSRAAAPTVPAALPLRSPAEPHAPEGPPAPTASRNAFRPAAEKPAIAAPGADTLPGLRPWSPPPVEISRRDTGPAPRAEGGASGTALAAGGLLLLLAFGCAAASALGAAWYYLGREPDSVAPAARELNTAPLAGSGAPSGLNPAGVSGSPAAAGGTAISVTMEGAPVQWIRVRSVLGATVLEGESSLEGSLPPDTYILALKQVGRPALKGEFRMPEAGAPLVCAPAKDATVACTGLASLVVLKP